MTDTDFGFDAPWRPLVAAVALALAVSLVPGPGATAIAPAEPVAAEVAAADAEVRLHRVASSRLSAASRSVAARARLSTSAYSLVAMTWRGEDPRIALRTHSIDGGWSGWRPLETLADLGAAPQRGSELAYVGPSDGIQTRVSGEGHFDLRIVLLDPGAPTQTDVAAAGRSSGAAPSAARAVAPSRAPQPTVRSRKSWGANNAWRNGKPRYNRTIQQVHVHHTVNGNDYRRREVPGILRAIYRYHTHNLGWFDIGYNFLVDRFGRAWVGRSGGARKPVRGAHTLGFNKTSVGIALIGNAESKAPKAEVKTTLVKLAAWKLDKYDRDPRGKVKVHSSGSDKYAKGEIVKLPVIDGHRDTNATACPGQYLYDKLPKIRERAGARVDKFS